MVDESEQIDAETGGLPVGTYEAKLNAGLAKIGAMSINEQLKPKLGKFSFNLHVDTLDDCLWYFESQAKEALCLQNKIALEYGGKPDAVPADHELYDYVVGKAGAFSDAYNHLKNVMENNAISDTERVSRPKTEGDALCSRVEELEAALRKAIAWIEKTSGGGETDIREELTGALQ